jgi:hypothetical protein
MHQALHIFKKDIRYLRNEIALVLLIAILLAALHSPEMIRVIEFALLGAAAFLIGRLVLAETIPGDRQFWITRPYRWPSLLGAKVLFIVAFVNVPICLAQLFILIEDGFPLAPSVPGLLWSQVLLFAFVSLPFAALAALSSGMVPFIFAQLIVLAAGYAVWELLVVTGTARLAGVDWIRDSIACIALCVTAVPVLFLQYRRRRTVFSRWFAMGGIVVAVVAYITAPLTLALALETHLSKQPSLGSSMQVTLGQHFGEQFWRPQLEPKVMLHIPISVEGIPAGTEMQPDALTISLQGSDGRTAKLGAADCGDLKRGTISASAATISALCGLDPAFFQSLHDRGVTFRATLYFTLFGNTRSQTIPLTDVPSNALDGLQCYTNVVKAQWDVYCRSAFRWPDRLVYAKLGHTNADSFAQFVSYSPFPATLNIDPVETSSQSARRDHRYRRTAGASASRL